MNGNHSEIFEGKISEIAGSFRDPDGQVFRVGPAIYRAIRERGLEHFERLHKSGLYEELTSQSLLIPHNDAPSSITNLIDAPKVIEPQLIPFISHPYEWCFSQLRDAALCTLEIQMLALDKSMILADASAFNIQFYKGRPLLIDTLSLKSWDNQRPWAGYRQFCEHFLGPLALRQYRNMNGFRFMEIWLEGVSLRTISRLLPLRTWLKPGLLMHLHFHSLAQHFVRSSKFPSSSQKTSTKANAVKGLALSLKSSVNGTRWTAENDAWSHYYEEGVASNKGYRQHKEAAVKEMWDFAKPRTAWDLGANTGNFSRLAADSGIRTIAFDSDPACVELLYRKVRESAIDNLLPLVMNLTAPSPSAGWTLKERASLFERDTPDMVMALALIHHLAIAHNIPLKKLPAFFAKLAPWIIAEFVPKSDPMSQQMLVSREDIFHNYTIEAFEMLFAEKFVLHKKVCLKDSQRILYLMERKRS